MDVKFIVAICKYKRRILYVTQEWIDKIELDILVLSLVNDHYANIQLKKEQERQAAQVKAARTSVAPINIINPVASAVPVLNYGPRRKVLSEGECRTHALLRAVCPDGSTHTRPLCTSGDVLLALHELLDPTIFLHGCVQLPHVLTDTCERHTEGYYRYIYDLNGPGRWQYLRYAPCEFGVVEESSHNGGQDQRSVGTSITLDLLHSIA